MPNETQTVTVEELLDGLSFAEEIVAFIRKKLNDALAKAAMEEAKDSMKVSVPVGDEYPSFRKLFRSC